MLLFCFVLMLGNLPAEETVELVLKGSKTVKGELVRENLKGIVLKGENRLIPWVQVESVNGRTVRERLTQIQQTNKDVLCLDCRGGLASLTCPECLGLGKIYAQTKPCTKCSGGPGTPCSAKGCEKGKVDCPGPCLKRSVGIWKDNPRLGLPCRIFIRVDESGKVKGDTQISEHHIGEAFDFKLTTPVPNCQKCIGTKNPCKDCREVGTYVIGLVKSLGDCKMCGGVAKGAGKLPCSTCQGTAMVPCTECMGTKSLPVLESAAACSLCKDGIVPCALCDNTGINDPKAGRNPVVPSQVQALRTDLRQTLARIDELNLQVTERAILRDGRSLQGAVVLRGNSGIVLAAREPATGGIRISILLNKQGYRLAGASSSAPAPAPQEEAAPVPAPKPTPDTVVLKDGTSVSGKIVAKSEELVVVQTPDGKFIKIEAAKVAEIRSQPKAPK